MEDLPSFYVAIFLYAYCTACIFLNKWRYKKIQIFLGAYGSVSFLTFSFNFIFLFIHIHTSLKWQILKPSLKTIIVLTCTSLNRCIYHTIVMSYHRQCGSESEGSSLLFKSTIFLNFLFKISTESYRKTIGSSAFSPVPSLSNTMMRAHARI